MRWRVYLQKDNEDEYIDSYPTREEAELVAEHAHEESGSYCFVRDQGNEIVFRTRWHTGQPRVARNQAHLKAVQAELDRLDALENLVQTADLGPIANLLKSLGKNS